VTPRALDRDALHAKLRMLRDLLDDLEQLGELTQSELAEDRVRRYAVERIVTQLVELAASVNSHIAASTLGRGPTDYRESFTLAARAGAISADLAQSLRPSVGLRNVLTHEYATIDLGIVSRSIPVALTNYRRYVREVARFLADKP
jgi:uncharacterized protein YutE (UPF0331/DUF86 family)